MTTHLPISPRDEREPARVDTATASGAAVGFAPGPNVATPIPGQPYTSGSTLISFDNQLLQNPLSYWVLPPYTGPAMLQLHFAVNDGSVNGSRGMLVGLDDVGDLQQTFQKTSGVQAFFTLPGTLNRPSGPTFLKRSFAPAQAPTIASYQEPALSRVSEPELFIPGRRVVLWVYGHTIDTFANFGTSLFVTGGIYAMGAA